MCENPTCKLESELETISVNKLAKTLGYGEDRNSASKLKKGLLNITVAGENVIMINEVRNNAFITVISYSLSI